MITCTGMICLTCIIITGLICLTWLLATQLDTFIIDEYMRLRQKYKVLENET